MKLSTHFSLHEFEYSGAAVKHGLINKAQQPHIDNLKLLADTILEPARLLLASPIAVSSGYRSAQVNSLPEVGGSSSSYHLQGKAADIWCRNNDRLLAILKTLPCTELIAYRDKESGMIRWIHVAYSKGSSPRIAYSKYV